jgi:diaminopimelate epimerase
MTADPSGDIAFDKYEGLGNDFVVIEARSEGEVTPHRAIALCDRHFGIGADGVLVVLAPQSPKADARMLVLNADGSAPEMCGNGARCVALHLARARGWQEGTVVLETAAGLRPCTVFGVQDGASQVTVDMGQVTVHGDRTIDLGGGEKVAFTVANAGNPHAVALGAFSRADVDRIGPRVEKHPGFPKGTNVEFARIASGGIDLVVWERGVGVTLACGTGACATAAVACAKGMASVGVPLAVRLPGGALEITVDKEGRTRMRGPARHVFSGRLA